MKGRAVWVIAALVGLGVLAALAARLTSAANYRFQGSVIEPALAAQDFSLQRTDGGLFRLSELRGRVVVMFFGYTNCPDICPTTMADFRVVETALGPDSSQIQFVFITVDPGRDTAEVAQRYAEAFSPTFIGLSGSEAELTPIWQAYYVYGSPPGSAGGGYTVEHTTRVIVVDKAGNFRMTFPYGLGPGAMESDLRYLIKEDQ
ncbi:MAG: SCO family protein [Chloroflexi bacterium]|nr:SCO family protein [Chloroflexota bacterium]